MRFLLTFSLLILFAVPVQADQVMAVLGKVVLTRDQQNYQVGNRSYLTDGDTLTTLENGGASFSLGNGVFVYTGSNTQLKFQSGQLQLVQGEVRILTRKQLNVRAGDANVVVGKGIHLIGVSPTASRFACQAGSARLEWNSDSQIAIRNASAVRQASYQSGGNGRGLISQSMVVDPQSEVFLVAGEARQTDPQKSQGWNIQVAQLQQQGINNAAAQTQGAAANQGVPPVVQPGQTGSTDPANQNAAAQPNQLDDDQRQQPDQAANNQRGGNDDASLRRTPDANATQFGSSSLGSLFTGFSSTAGASASGGLFADANQSTNQGRTVPGNNPFPGNIHLVTADTPYSLGGLTATDAQLDTIVANNSNVYYSVGQGALPTTQVSTDLGTATNSNPNDINAVRVNGTNNFVVQFDQYPVIDPINPAALGSNVGIAGLVGSNPVAPSVNGATPMRDERAQFNDRATFSLGEFRLGRDAAGNLEFAVRRSDQDRLLIKDPGGNDANDLVTPNTDVTFADAVDARFLPAAPTVKIPTSLNTRGTRFSELGRDRRAAATTVLADQLHDLSRTTGQTRFVVDGRIVDISGYRK